MSADNYGTIHKTPDGKYGLSMGFASYEGPVDLSRPYFVDEDLDKVIDFANKEYFEYGYTINFNPNEGKFLLEPEQVQFLKELLDWASEHLDDEDAQASAEMLREALDNTL